MFVVIYQPSDTPDYSKIVKLDKKGVTFSGKWQVDTDETGKVFTYSELEFALDRVNYIRKCGGEACLAVIIE